ncbi:hypothetical protein AAC387_Pa02g0518 [Persea americana]
MVAKLKWKGNIPNNQGLCEAEGLNNEKVARLGGEMLLLSFSNLEEALPKLESLELELSELFLSLERWKPGIIHTTRTLWVKCYGVPLHAWDESTFMSIGRKIGEVIQVAKETIEKSSLENGRVFLRVESPKPLTQFMKKWN